MFTHTVMGFDALRAETRGLRSEKLSVGIHHFEILERPFLCQKERFFEKSQVFVANALRSDMNDMNGVFCQYSQPFSRLPLPSYLLFDPKLSLSDVMFINFPKKSSFSL